MKGRQNAMPGKSFDVFLSYNREDEEPVEKIAVYLADCTEVKPWMDKWNLIPGEPWFQHLERALTSSSACAVFVGKSGEGPWQQKELAAALDRQVKNPDFRVIPVLLADALAKPDLPIFLAGNTWVDFRGTRYDEALWRVECGIRGIPPGRGKPRKDEECRVQQPKPQPHMDPTSLIRPGGAIDVGSRFYIRRVADEEVLNEVTRVRGLVNVLGPRQTGKTSLILQTYVNVRRMEPRLRSVFVDFQLFDNHDIESQEAVWRAIAVKMQEQLALDAWGVDKWVKKADFDRNFSGFLDGFVFAADDTPVLLCLDEVDRVFSSPLKSDFFSSVRAFHNQGAYDHIFKKMRWLLSTSSEPRFFIEDLNQSPFNVGLRVDLNTFSAEETAEFARRHGLEVDAPLLGRIHEYTGGRPFLVHLFLYHTALKPESRERFFDAQSGGGGIFRDHLNHYLKQFQKDRDLRAAMRKVIAGKGCDDLRMADRLEASGLARNDPEQRLICHCRLYRDYFSKVLEA
ncbi:MAG: AAA-like domain-containing protein [Thermodesulfobacteriota bacterium]